MNLIILWGFEIPSDSLNKLFKELKVNFCGFLSNQGKIDPPDGNIEWDILDMDRAFPEYEDMQSELLPLDEDIIIKMQKFEVTAMDVIYRWRRSITTQEDYKEIRRIYFILLRYWNDYIINHKINGLILHNVPHAHTTYMLYALCKAYDIPVIFSMLMPIIKGGYLNKYLASGIEEIGLDFIELYYENAEKYRNADEDSISLSSNFQLYFNEYLKRNDDVGRVIVFENKKNLHNLVKLINVYKQRSMIYISQKRYRILANKAFNLLKIRIHKSEILGYEEKLEQEPDLDKKFVFFPLHCQPEASTLPLSGIYNDQLLIINLVSSLLPEGVLLYVKEHPAYWNLDQRYESVKESRSKAYYDSICKLKNVRLIKHEYSSLKLIDNCYCLVTATGSAGLEALFRNKPVLIFGNTFYSYSKGAYRIHNREDCRKAIDEIFGDEKVEITKKDLKILFHTLESMAISIGVGEGSHLDGYPDMSDEECARMTVAGWLHFIDLKYKYLIREGNNPPIK